MATVYAVASAKGGVGKTTTTAAIATILAGSGADVVAIDADIGMANLAGAVGVAPGETTLHDVLAGRADPDDAVHDGPAGLRVVPGAPGLDAYAAADPSELKAVVTAFDDADYVLVDAGAGLSHDSTLPLGIADETLLVSTAELSALGDTEKTRQLTERIGGTVAGAAITRVNADVDSDSDVTETLDATVLGRIPEDDAVMRAVAAGEPLPTFAPTAQSTRAYRDLARALTGADVEGDGLEEGIAVGSDESDGDDQEGDDGPVAAEDETEKHGSGDDESAERSEPIGGGRSVEEAQSDGESTAIADADSEVEEDAERVEDDKRVEDTEETADADDTAKKSVGGSDADNTADADGVDTADLDEGDEEDESDGDIIVADSERAGLGEPSGEEEIIVANESSAPADDEPEATGTEPEAADNGIDDETEAVGEKHVGVDDLEAMIEDDLGEAEQFGVETDPATSEHRGTADDATADHGTGGADPTDDDATVDTEVGTSSGSDMDDELEGSVPFRDDDTGGMKSVRSDEDAEAENGEKAGEEEDDSRGFFSRLLGR